MIVTDTKNIGIVMSVWAIHDDYDYQDEENYISVTSLMKPIKQIILGARAPKQETIDISDFVSRAMGTAIHASVEKAWEHYEVNLKKLGYPKEVIDRVRINPEPEELFEGCIPIYIEQRAKKKIAGYTVGGKFDMVAEGIVHDNKTTSAYTWVFGGRDDEHKMQGSLYRWLNPEKITENFIRINYLFTDWQAMMARQKPTYPQARIQQKDIILLEPAETERWVVNKLNTLSRLWNADENSIPDCTDEELWRSDPVYKYYKDPAKTDGKSTKNFDDASEAYQHLAVQGVGVVKEFPGTVKRCGYCAAYEVCQQRRKYFPD